MSLIKIILCVAVANGMIQEQLPEMTKIIHCEKTIVSKELSDTALPYYCEDTGNMIYHSSQLRTSSNLNDVFLSEHFDIGPEDWIEVAIDGRNQFHETRGIPYTSCLTFENGTSGGLQASVSDSYGLGTSFDLKFAFLNFAIGKVSSSIASSIGGSLSMTAEYFCKGMPGQTLQIQLIHELHVFRNCRWRKLSVDSAAKVKRVLRGEWSILPVLKAAVSTPTVRCVSDPSLLQCGSLQAT